MNTGAALKDEIPRGCANRLIQDMGKIGDNSDEILRQVEKLKEGVSEACPKR